MSDSISLAFQVLDEEFEVCEKKAVDGGRNVDFSEFAFNFYRVCVDDLLLMEDDETNYVKAEGRAQ